MSDRTETTSSDVAGDGEETLSIVVPVYNEEENVGPMYEEIVAALDDLGRDAEILFVDDGSADGTLEILKGLQQSDPRVKVIVLRRNFGQTAAMAAGFSQVQGDIIIAMDGDLQNDPADIGILLAKHAEGYDLVSGWRKDRKDKWLTRRVPSQIANRLISSVTGTHLHDYGCALKLYTRDTIDSLRIYGELHRFIPALASWRGSRVAEVVVNHRARQFGVSKYGLSRTMRVILDLLTVRFLLQYSSKPLHIFGRWGLLSGSAGFAIAVYLTVLKLGYQQDIGERPLLLLGVLLMVGGLQLITMGLLAELQVHALHEARGTPSYVVRDTLGEGLGADDANRGDDRTDVTTAKARPERSDAA